MEVAPFRVAADANFAQFLYLTGQYDRALEQVRKTLQLDSNYPQGHELLGLVYEQEGRADLAIQELQRAVDLSNGYIGTGSLGHLYARLNRLADAQEAIQKLVQQAKQRYVAPFEIALIHAGLGETNQTLDDLEKGYRERSLSAQSLRFDPRLNEVRASPRFRDFTRRIGLQWPNPTNDPTTKPPHRRTTNQPAKQR